MGKFVYQGKNFYLNGKKFVIRSGAIHYFRILKCDWRDRLLKLKECGLNCVETYVAWNIHEPYEGQFVFDGNLDLGEYIDLADSLGLKVIVRPGPYICAEWEAGGLPFWLLNYPLHIRCDDELFFDKLKPYLLKVFEIINPRLVANGGNVIMMQVENEYGNYGNDKNYLLKLKEFYESSLDDCLLFTSDSPEEFCMKSGTLPDVLACANFGSEVEGNFKKLEKFRADQPLVCAEFWCGWFDFWGGEHHRRSVESKIRELEAFIQNDYGFNVYMFCGGSNFGFMNGANLVENRYQPTVTSYDYDALLTEAGDRTEAYYALRELIRKKTKDVPALTAKESVKKAYGKVRFSASAELFDNLDRIGTTKLSAVPLSMEEMGEGQGYILYKTRSFSGGTLYLDELKDRANVFCNGKAVGICERGVTNSIENLETENGRCEIAILIENMGRINFGYKMFDRKGVESVRIWAQTLFGYENIILPMNNLECLKFLKLPEKLYHTPAFYKGQFIVDEVGDSFLKLEGFQKGFAVINGFNLGRYFTAKGPQKTLYVPAGILKKGENELVVFDSDGSIELNAEFVDKPVL